MSLPIRIAISACLLGHEVRYDGKHKKQPWLAALRDVQWVPICPEVEAGMSIPREKIQVELHEGELKLRAIESRIDWSDRMDQVARQWIEQLSEMAVCGLILKSRSPSCGIKGVPIYQEGTNQAVSRGQGRFAQRVAETLSELPIADEEAMADENGRREFLRCVSSYRRSLPS